MSRHEWESKFKDSVMNGITNEVNFKDTITQSEAPVKILSARPVQKEYSNYKDIRLSYKNVSNKTITAIRFKWHGLNAFNEPADMGIMSDGFGGGFSDDRLRPGKTDYGVWSILSRDLKKVTKAWVTEVVFEDGTKWESDK